MEAKELRELVGDFEAGSVGAKLRLEILAPKLASRVLELEQRNASLEAALLERNLAARNSWPGPSTCSNCRRLTEENQRLREGLQRCDATLRKIGNLKVDDADSSIMLACDEVASIAASKLLKS